jgi:polysaccharide pyruvyl transferase WcaK-like protein
MTKPRPTKISLFGHFGSANLGNEATLVAMVSCLRATFPDCELSCICTGPENVVAAYSINGVPHTARSRRIWDRRLSLPKRLGMLFFGVGEEVGEYIRAWRILSGTDMFIVPGTGLLTDAFELSGWGPYGLFKWSLVARLRRCKVMFVSVGAGPIETFKGRLLVKLSLAFADYRSYRDRPSKEVVESLGLHASGDRIYPDLVFALPSPESGASTIARDVRPTVALGLMAYSEKYSEPDAIGGTYERYVRSLAAFADWLLDHDYDISLLVGDAAVDTMTIRDVKAALQRPAHDIDERVVDHSFASTHEFLSHLCTTDFVVATRFHNVLMSLLSGRPVVAISFHHKCSSLMSEMGMSDYCLDINRITPDRMVEKFEALVQHSDELNRMIRQHVERSRSALAEQYELLFREELGQLPLIETESAAG